jgi:hypothetical protein
MIILKEKRKNINNQEKDLEEIRVNPKAHLKKTLKVKNLIKKENIRFR